MLGALAATDHHEHLQVEPENIGSARVAEKANMRYEGLADYHGLTGLKMYGAERDWWKPPSVNAAPRSR